MKPTKQFSEWYALYGLMHEAFSLYRDYSSAKRIAWRAYRKGRKDEKAAQKNTK